MEIVICIWLIFAALILGLQYCINETIPVWEYLVGPLWIVIVVIVFIYGFFAGIIKAIMSNSRMPIRGV